MKGTLATVFIYGEMKIYGVLLPKWLSTETKNKSEDLEDGGKCNLFSSTR